MNKKFMAILAIGIFAMVSASGCITGDVAGGSSLQNEMPVNDQGYFSVPVSDISQNAKFFSYDSDGTEIRFFAVRSSSGEIKTAFDACDVCGGSKGYTQDGSDMICNKCGRYFAIDQLGSQNKGGGCWPSYLPHTIENNQIKVLESDLETGKWMF